MDHASKQRLHANRECGQAIPYVCADPVGCQQNHPLYSGAKRLQCSHGESSPEAETSNFKVRDFFLLQELRHDDVPVLAGYQFLLCPVTGAMEVDIKCIARKLITHKLCPIVERVMILSETVKQQ